MNSWIKHVKEYSKKHNMKFNECLKNADCKAAYRKNKNQSGSGIVSDVANNIKSKAKKVIKNKIKEKVGDLVDNSTNKLNKIAKDKVNEIVGSGVVMKKKKPQKGSGLIKTIGK